MPRKHFALTEQTIKASIKKAKETGKREEIADGDGLSLIVTPGWQSWKLRIYTNGKEKLRGLGGYPETTLKQAREKAQEIKLNPNKQEITPVYFRDLAASYLEYAEKDKKVAANTLKKARIAINAHLLPTLANSKTDTITKEQIIDIYRDMAAQNLKDQPAYVLRLAKDILEYAKVKCNVEINVAATINKKYELPKIEYIPQHRAAVTSASDIRTLMQLISGYGYADDTVRNALNFLAYTFVRPGKELLEATWAEIDCPNFDDTGAVWHIPAERVKTRVAHDIPLSKQAVEILKAQAYEVARQHKLQNEKLSPKFREYGYRHQQTVTDRNMMPKEFFTGSRSSLKDILENFKGFNFTDKFIFPSPAKSGWVITKTPTKDGGLLTKGSYSFYPLSDCTLNNALRHLGITKMEHSAHGFRGTASTVLNENKFDSDYIEALLAHTDKNRVRAAYNHAKYWPQRVAIMQWYADYLDALRDGKPLPAKPTVETKEQL